ncbi:MAG TPA: 50S ribosomal protein L11 methyltransferase [Burkholderiales bacterium]
MASRALRVEVEHAAADALSDALLDAGAESVSIEALDSPRAVLSALFAEAADPASALARALERCGEPPRIAYTLDALQDKDWVRSSQAQFTPLRVGRLWIGASWHEPPDDAAQVVRIDPGLAFGTGSHPTTKLVLEFLDRTMRGGERVLDYGCGSGILAIAAAKLGAARVDAVDLDPKAIEVTRENARVNAVAVGAYLPEALAPGRYDVLVANILAQPLIALAPLFAARTERGARIALAGVLESQAEGVVAPYAAHFDMTLAARDESWVLISGARR